MPASKKKMVMPSANKEDRLSSLPDSLLIAILSLLPIDSAAATSVLSHRWRHLWTHITHLSFSPPWGPTSDHFLYFMNTVNHILFQLTSSKIHTFHLHYLTSFEEDQIDVFCLAYLVPWIHLIFRCNAEVIKVNFQDIFPIRSLDLPTRFLESQYLEILEFDTNIRFNFPADGVINLPNLKKLRMTLYDSHRCLIEKLFKSCPLLEDLYLSLLLLNNNHIIDISAPHLKGLRINSNIVSSCKFVIDAPKLERFEIEGTLSIYDFVKNPRNLQEARISVDESNFSNENDYLSKRLGLFRGISCAKSLILHKCSIPLMDSLVGFNLPTFHNLVHLSLTCGDLDLDSDNIDWSPQIPSCFLGKLKKIQVFEMIGNLEYDQELKLLNHILSNAPDLELIQVYLFHHIEDVYEAKPQQLWNEYMFCKELFKLSRSSLDCQIKFYGNMFTSSSNDFRNGVLPWQIVE